MSLYQLEVIRVRLAYETKRDARSSLRSICQQIYHERPYARVAAPLSGAPSVVQDAVSAAVPRSGIVARLRGRSGSDHTPRPGRPANS